MASTSASETGYIHDSSSESESDSDSDFDPAADVSESESESSDSEPDFPDYPSQRAIHLQQTEYLRQNLGGSLVDKVRTVLVVMDGLGINLPIFLDAIQSRNHSVYALFHAPSAAGVEIWHCA
ncbi:hypothetical protein B0H10DRAFT_1952970 [Mycena sp. CBHHK59/15]|nr:hypothetical protein B0H10DRAFT_1952970 [Mycena sp. CBHHK59/15]